MEPIKTEPIKQEIINNIFENGDKLITGPILQTVLIDMIDDVNVKDQEILSKTGSWDEAVTQIPNLATKAEVTNLSESVARDLENVDVDLTGYATEQWVQDQGYLKEHQDISNLATKTELTEAENNLQGNITSLSESVARDLANVSVPEGVATEAWVQSQDYASKSYVDNAVSSSSVDLTGYATETWVESQGYLKEHQDISNLATKSELNSVSESIQTDIANLATKGELTSVSESVQTDITNLSESVANSAVWKKGTGTDSIVQKLTGNNEANTSVASGGKAIATGFATEASGYGSHTEGARTKASGSYSHAEGQDTLALGRYSHAEGYQTSASNDYSHAEGCRAKASGYYSHAEGYYTITSNDHEHAQGRYNCTSSNQIFSIGAGEDVNETVTRRNAVSVLVVPNADTSIITASFFVQNIGGYDGTNPLPGTNDLATVINSLPSGGSSETLWKKGEGEDSIVQKLSGDNEAFTPTATGYAAIALGFATTASGDFSHAEGSNTVASEIWSHAEGSVTISSGRYSHAEGSNTLASGSNSHAEGQETKALYQADHAEGYGTIASGGASHAEGTCVTASGYYSHAEGDNTKAEGESSHAEGYKASATGRYGHAEGDTSNASGLASHAEGQSTLSSGQSSHAEGFFTVASNDYEHAQGQYNHNSTNQIFSVGAGEKIGETVTRRNAVSILEVPNSDTQVVTASFFVQNVGGYDGTNPTPGTNDLATVVSKVSSIWKKGEGGDSIVQILTGDYEALTPTATGTGAIAIGSKTSASGICSHAQGSETKASGPASHAEGSHTTASGMFSHAEGGYTVTSNEYEHAQGRFNHNSENQIFSIGTGNSNTDRRNAVSVLEVSSTGSYTSSFFVQNIGGYDGTNPLPGTNDLATVINGMSSGGGSSETLWKKGEGQDSMVQVIASGIDQPKATGERAIATGYWTRASGSYSHAEGNGTETSGSESHAEGIYTKASGDASHAEGWRTEASGQSSHAEGQDTNASGINSHAEGTGTVASNSSEHAQGRLNHNSENQIFSVGAGDGDPNVPESVTRRNAVSILAVDNNGSYTGSFFVQNIGGYDGTNPLPGTNDLATVINGMSTGGGSSETLWKKGTGTDSVVQTIADGTSLPTATGNRAIATGMSTTASGANSHAEGSYTIASGESSHAEGDSSNALGIFSHTEGANTVASGDGSHAEGIWTKTSNNYEHAQGRYNHSSTNQIFSIGTGNSNTDRRNAVSVLEVSNNDSYTSSFFVQNVGGYDGTNPTPGTNDLATVINNLSSGGGSSSGGSSETLWKKGEGVDSIVQVKSGALGVLFTPKATGESAIATGRGTKATGQYSHAEGEFTIASNSFEHAQGRYNYTSSNQIFSIGVGINNTDRRNAVSVLEVSDNSSFFVRNVGGYDGTNPEPGTNDLATVINGLSSGGGTGTSTETWTFTLDNGSTVTKNIVIA